LYTCPGLVKNTANIVESAEIPSIHVLDWIRTLQTLLSLQRSL
jgi:hypothetical protein